MSKFNKPKKFDRNLIVIGAGAAGLVTSYIAAAVKAKVTLIEGHAMGGDCLNTGCVPSKSLIRSAKIVNYMDRAREFGLKPTLASFDFAEIMNRVQRSIETIEPHDSVERYTELGVECIKGYARFVSPWEVEVNGKTLSARNIVIATGAKPFVPPIPGLEEVGYQTSDTVWSLRNKPKRMVVLGGGPIGCELSQAFARLGIEIIQIEMMPRLLLREDEEVSDIVARSLERDGVQVLTDHKVVGAEMIARDKVVVCDHKGKQVAVHCDEILVAVGRAANTESLGIDLLGLETNKNGTLVVDKYLRTTRHPNILACGDVAGPYQFTHTAAHQAWYASVNGLFAPFKKFKADYSVIPWCTFTDPEVARVGLNELEAKEKNISCEVTTYGIDDLDRAICEEEAHGFVKVLTRPGKDKILGVTIVGHHAGDLIAEFVLAMKHGIGLNKILGTIHIYPTWNEANRYVAGEWKQKNKPEFALKLLEKYHNWRRG
ncbi:MAG: mercuric reductase [Ketobacteraceae bacterium]|nr:mercuric reductase [Ketobacteraceae bacterium]